MKIIFIYYFFCFIGIIPVPRDADSIKLFREDLIKVLHYLQFLSEPKNAENINQIIASCLRCLYDMITVKNPPPSGAVSIVFDFFNEQVIPSAITWMVTQPDSDEKIKTAVILLCTWLRTTNFTTYLKLWIIGILNGLREKQKYELLREISLEVIEKMFKALMLPIYRENVSSVVMLILASVRDSPVVFHKIIPEIPKVLQVLKKDANRPPYRDIIQNIVDLISYLLHEFPTYDDKYKDVVSYCYVNKGVC